MIYQEAVSKTLMLMTTWLPGRAVAGTLNGQGLEDHMASAKAMGS